MTGAGRSIFCWLVSIICMQSLMSGDLSTTALSFLQSLQTAMLPVEMTSGGIGVGGLFTGVGGVVIVCK
jgi:hypothetical protein